MEASTFDTLSQSVNIEYLSRLFSIPVNKNSSGINLIDHSKKIGIELSSAYSKDKLEEGRYSFKIDTHKIYEYEKKLHDYNLYFAFVPFELKRPFREILDINHNINPNFAKNMVKRREFWVFEWNYMHTFTQSAISNDKIIEIHLEQKSQKSIYEIFKLPDPDANKKFSRIETQKPGNLYIRPDKTSAIIKKDVKVYFDMKHCEQLWEEYIPTRFGKKTEQSIFDFEERLEF